MSSSSQNTNKSYTVVSTSKYGTVTYDFDFQGRPVKITSKDIENKIWYNADFYYGNDLTDSIYTCRLGKYPEKKHYIFTYNSLRKISSQHFIEEGTIPNEERAEFVYGPKGTLDTIKKLNENNLIRKYDDLNRIIEETSTYAYTDKPEHYEITYFTYADDRTIKRHQYHTTMNVIESTTTYEFMEGNLVRELFDSGGTKKYLYSDNGLLKREISAAAVFDYKIILQTTDLKEPIVKKMNKILLANYSDINWYK